MPLLLQSQRHLEIVAAETSEHAASHNGQSKPKRRVVVTGMGCVTSLGHDPKEFYDNLLEVGLSLFDLHMRVAGYSPLSGGHQVITLREESFVMGAK